MTIYSYFLLNHSRLLSPRRRRLTAIWILIINLRQSDNRSRFIMGIPIPIKSDGVFSINKCPGYFPHCNDHVSWIIYCIISRIHVIKVYCVTILLHCYFCFLSFCLYFSSLCSYVILYMIAYATFALSLPDVIVSDDHKCGCARRWLHDTFTYGRHAGKRSYLWNFGKRWWYYTYNLLKAIYTSAWSVILGC